MRGDSRFGLDPEVLIDKASSGKGLKLAEGDNSLYDEVNSIQKCMRNDRIRSALQSPNAKGGRGSTSPLSAFYVKLVREGESRASNGPDKHHVYIPPARRELSRGSRGDSSRFITSNSEMAGGGKERSLDVDGQKKNGAQQLDVLRPDVNAGTGRPQTKDDNFANTYVTMHVDMQGKTSRVIRRRIDDSEVLIGGAEQNKASVGGPEDNSGCGVKGGRMRAAEKKEGGGHLELFSSDKAMEMIPDILIQEFTVDRPLDSIIPDLHFADDTTKYAISGVDLWSPRRTQKLKRYRGGFGALPPLSIAWLGNDDNNEDLQLSTTEKGISSLQQPEVAGSWVTTKCRRMADRGKKVTRSDGNEGEITGLASMSMSGGSNISEVILPSVAGGLKSTRIKARARKTRVPSSPQIVSSDCVQLRSGSSTAGGSMGTPVDVQVSTPAGAGGKI